jgi:putative transposase
LTNLSHKVGRGTVANVLKRNGIEPAPERRRRTQWSTFLKAHWKVLAASDFFTAEVWTGRGLVTHYVLFKRR